MAIMTGPFKNITEKISSSPIISGNSPNVNTILLLLLVSYFIVGADLSKEMARERGEFKFFAGILTESNTVDSFAYLDFMLIDPPVVGEVIYIHFSPPLSDVAETNRSRAPPVQS
jgi:hypothetical protein